MERCLHTSAPLGFSRAACMSWLPSAPVWRSGLFHVFLAEMDVLLAQKETSVIRVFDLCFHTSKQQQVCTTLFPFMLSGT